MFAVLEGKNYVNINFIYSFSSNLQKDSFIVLFSVSF